MCPRQIAVERERFPEPALCRCQIINSKTVQVPESLMTTIPRLKIFRAFAFGFRAFKLCKFGLDSRSNLLGDFFEYFLDVCVFDVVAVVPEQAAAIAVRQLSINAATGIAPADTA